VELFLFSRLPRFPVSHRPSSDSLCSAFPCVPVQEAPCVAGLWGREFGSSVGWFLRMYPLAFTEVYVYRGCRGALQESPPPSGQECKVAFSSQ